MSKNLRCFYYVFFKFIIFLLFPSFVRFTVNMPIAVSGDGGGGGYVGGYAATGLLCFVLYFLCFIKGIRIIYTCRRHSVTGGSGAV